jgi:hypothetical protein
MTKNVPLGIISLSLWNDAQAFILAADSLVQNSQVDLPTYFLLGHALELTIKAYLAAHGLKTRELKKVGHDLQRAFENAVSLGLKIENQDAVTAMVRAISEFHNAHVFRYPVINKDGDLVIIRTLFEASDVLKIVTAVWRRVEADAVKAMLLAVEGDRFPVEEWYMGGRPPQP